jgi:hypothetical protein
MRKLDYCSAAANGDVGDDGRLTSLPSAWDARKHRLLTMSDFALPEHYLRWRAHRLQERAEQTLATATDLLDQADTLSDVATSDEQHRLLRLEKRRARLRRQLDAISREERAVKAKETR